MIPRVACMSIICSFDKLALWDDCSVTVRYVGGAGRHGGKTFPCDLADSRLDTGRPSLAPSRYR